MDPEVEPHNTATEACVDQEIHRHGSKRCCSLEGALPVHHASSGFAYPVGLFVTLSHHRPLRRPRIVLSSLLPPSSLLCHPSARLHDFQFATFRVTRGLKLSILLQLSPYHLPAQHLPSNLHRSHIYPLGRAHFDSASRKAPISIWTRPGYSNVASICYVFSFGLDQVLKGLCPRRTPSLSTFNSCTGHRCTCPLSWILGKCKSPPCLAYHT